MRSGDLVAATSSHVSAPPSIKIARSTQSTSAATRELNTQAYGSNAASYPLSSINESDHKRREAWVASKDHSVSEVYSNFISAVSRSLSHSLGKGQGWVQVGPYACIDVRTLGDDLFDVSELYPSATTTKLSLDVKWLSSGTLLISFSQTRLPRHIRMSAMLSKAGNPPALAVGSLLLLSPSGVRCKYLGLEESPNNDVQRKSIAEVKASISSRLAHQGIRIVPDVTWIRIQTERDTNISKGPLILLWPADLCFCEDVIIPVTSVNCGSFNSPIVDGSIDPLEEAESWFLGKAARTEALQARLREENQEAQVLKDVEDLDDEDSLSPFGIPLDQGITPQDVSGIYPTPPDAILPPLLVASSSNKIQSGDYDDEEKELRPNDQVHGDYDAQENDDLFEDMDIDMFASNGLTEADFSFFDEPGVMDEDLRETGQVMTLDEANETNEHSVAYDERGLRVTPHEIRDNESDRNVAQDRENLIERQGMASCYPIAWSSSTLSKY